MKKTIIVLFILISTIKAQMQPGVNYMPHISFFDFAVNYLSNPNEDLATSSDIWYANEANGWYLDALHQLGMTNLVTDAQYHQNSLNEYPKYFFLNDMGFQWKHDPSANPPRSFLPAKYMNAFGHWREKFVIQVGGSYRSTISSNDIFGFGEIGNDNLDASYWVLRPFQGQPTTELTGHDIRDDFVDPSKYARAAIIGTDDAGKPMVWAQLPSSQFPLNTSLKIRVYFRRSMTQGNVDLFTLHARGISTTASGAHTYAPRRDFFKTEVQSNTPLSEFVYVVNTQMLESRHLTKYDSLDIGVINIAANNHFYFQIDWAGNADLYIDKITVFNSEYDELYESKTVTKAQIVSDFNTKYGSFNIQKLQSFYYDEPFQLSARYRGEMQDTLRTMLQSTFPFIEINGAVGGVPKHFLDFDTSYAKAKDNEKFVRHYINYNMYPIVKNTETTTSSLQPRLDLFINYNNVDDEPGTHTDPNKYKYVGILPAQISAKELEVPLVVTLCVAGEQYVNNRDEVLSLVDGDHRRRPPTPDEIKAMGNISLAYGAKGFMYYMVPTRTASPHEGETEFNQYGLFEEEDLAFDPMRAATWIQNPAGQQVPNERYYAVKEFISSTSLIESDLLGLNWLESKSWNKDFLCSTNWITNLNAKYPYFEDDDNETFVETGFFVEKTPPAGKNEDAKYIYLVNRRCNLQPANTPDNPSNDPDTSYRNITFSLNFPTSIWNNYSVTDLKTDSVYCTTKTGTVTIFLRAGEGTLLKIEPTVQSGGTLIVNETIATNNTVSGDLQINSPSILTIDSGADITFANSAELIINNTFLYVIGTATDPCVLNFGTASWYGGNGIIASNAQIMIDKAVIKNAKYGIKSYNAQNFVVENTQLETCYYGILLENQSARFARLDNISLSQCYLRGLSANDSWITMSNFNITGCETGLWFDFCFVNEKYGDPAANLFLQNNSIGLYTTYSDLYLGEGDSYPVGAYNTFLNLDQNIEAENEAFVRVQSNYWANTSSKMINAWGGALVLDEPSFTYVPDNPLSGDGEDEELAAIKGTSNGEGTNVREKLTIARHHIRGSRFSQARKLCIDILEQNGDDPLVPMALLVLRQTFTPEEISNYKEYLLNGHKAAKGSIAKGMLTIAAFDLMEANVAIYDSICSEYAGKFPESYALYKKSLYQFGNLGDVKGAKITRNRLESKYPESIYLKDLNSRLSDSISFHPINSVPLGLPKRISNTVTEIVNEYQLFNNFPNPFNPETVIKFALKEKSNVTLDVYNIAGQKVAELISSEMEKGFYEKRFDGTNLSSGVYVIRLNAQSLEHVNTSFTKTIKALLLK